MTVARLQQMTGFLASAILPDALSCEASFKEYLRNL
jgi:hypothetical protein